MSKEQAHQMMEDLYKTVEFRDKKVFYDLKVFNGACNYQIWVNDMPVFNMYENARGELSFPINTEILKAGQQRLKIRIFPLLDENNNITDSLNKYAGLDVEIREMEWNAAERKFDYYPIFSYRTPRDGNDSLQENPKEFLFEEGSEDLPFYEEEVIFEAKVPYQLSGWSKSVNLKNQNSEELLAEVVAFYEELKNDFSKKDIISIAKKYATKEKEIAQSFFHTQKEAKTRWREDIIKEVLNPNATVGEIKKYQLKYFGDGKVVSLMRFPGKSPFYITIPDKDGSMDYYVYDIFLHRPKPGAPLEMIR